MTGFDIVVQQVINGLSLGAMYALLALGFTLVYGIAELINFAHFNVFMVGAMIAHADPAGVRAGRAGDDPDRAAAGRACWWSAFAVTMVACGLIGVSIERFLLRPLQAVKGPAAMITTIGVSYVLFNVVLLTLGSDSKNFPNPIPTHRLPDRRRRAAAARDRDLGDLARADGRR